MSALDQPLHGRAADEIRDRPRASELQIACAVARDMLRMYGPAIDGPNSGIADAEALAAVGASLRRVLEVLGERDGNR